MTRPTGVRLVADLPAPADLFDHVDPYSVRTKTMPKLTAAQTALLARVRAEGQVDLPRRDNQTAAALERRGLIAVTRGFVYWIARPVTEATGGNTDA